MDSGSPADFTKISHSGLLARSLEGHAAHGMSIKGNEDVWVEIQANTFRNWVNEYLPRELRVTDLSRDLCSGVCLCALVEALQERPIKPAWNKKPANQHHYLENVTAALNAIENDGVKLVNIGNVDIVNGNLKLILGLIWSLIVRYQIGRSKFPPRKLMLAWLQAVLPECKVSNLTTDWNSGILLSALIDYCKPGLFPHWRKLDKNNGIENCRRAMDIAQKQLKIPAVLEPEYLASPWLDELSGMTYLSYFMKPGSPGFYATLRWVNSRLERSVQNFTSDWNDGKVLSEIIRSLGGSAPSPEKLKSDPYYWVSNLTQAVEAGKRLGVEPILSAKDMADRNVEHLGVMAYAAHFQWVPERPPLHDLINVRLESTSGRVEEPTHFQIKLLDSSLSMKHVSVEIRGPDNKVYLVRDLKNGHGTFIPQKVGMHELVVFYEGQEVISGHYFRVLPPLVEVAPPGMAPCALGSLVQVLVNATGAPKREDIQVIAYSPHGRPLECPLTTVDGTNSATFKPDEAGEWQIEITYQGKQIQGGPFTCAVFDPDGVEVSGLEGALPLVPHTVDVDCRAVGVPGEVQADVVHNKKTVHSRIEKVDTSGYLYRVHFTPMEGGKHRVYIYFNGYDVRGSPFMLRVGSQRRSKTSNSPTFRKTSSVSPISSPTNRYASSSPIDTSYNSKNSNYYDGSPSLHDKYYYSSREYQKGQSEKYQYSGNKNDEFRKSASPSFAPRPSSPNFPPRPQSPAYYRNQSPNYNRSSPIYGRTTQMTSSQNHSSNTSRINRSQSPAIRVESPSSEYVSSKTVNERRHEVSSPSSYLKRREEYDYVSSAANNVSSLRISNSSPSPEHRLGSPGIYSERKSPGRNQIIQPRGYDETDRGIDTSPTVKVSTDDKHARRDSWDAIAKTKNILSRRSLESVANLTDSQLDSKLGKSGLEEETDGFLKRERDSASENYFRSYAAEESKYKSSLERRTAKSGNYGGASAIKVQPIPDGVLGKPVEFEIDGSGAGSGDLEILVEGGKVTSSVRSLGGQRFKAAFTPHQVLPHRVDIRFNGDMVPGHRRFVT